MAASSTSFSTFAQRSPSLRWSTGGLSEISTLSFHDATYWVTLLSGLRIMRTMRLETAKEPRKGDNRGQWRMFRARLVHGGASMITVSYRPWNPQNSLCSLAVLAGFGTSEPCDWSRFTSNWQGYARART